MPQNNYKKNQKTFLEIVVVGIFSAIWFLVKLPFSGIKKKRGISIAEKNEIISRRREIENLLLSQSEIELRHAVIEADKLVDYVLKLKGYDGETFADRLRCAEKYIDYNLYQQIWQGHKVRNLIAHENGKISIGELKSSAEKLLKYLRNL